jgi:hypothetical protein
MCLAEIILQLKRLK